ncbi:MAG: hypothetical protein ACLQD9_00690 [Thermoplasmata archaeon]
MTRVRTANGKGEDGIKRRFVTLSEMGSINLRPSFEWDDLRIHGAADRNKRPYLAGQPRKLVVVVENLKSTQRVGKLVFAWRHRSDQWPRVLPRTLGPRERKRLTIEDFVPPTEGVYDFRLVVGGPVIGNPVPALEWFGGKDDNWLKMGAAGWAFESIGSFKVFDAASYDEDLSRSKAEKTRWLTLVILAGVSAVAAVTLLVVELVNLGWLR